MDHNVYQTESVNNIKIIYIGNIKVTWAAFINLIAGIILSSVLAINIPDIGPFIGLFVLLLWMILTYNINCAQIGHCKKWAWILTIFYLIYASFISIMLITNKDSIIKKFKNMRNIRNKKK